MDEIEALRARIDSDRNVDAVRIAIADLIGRLIAERRDSLGYWEKLAFAQALSWLWANVSGGNRDSTAWLRICLVSLETALVPADRRNEHHTRRSPDIEALTADLLLAEVRALNGTV